jgi:hypothetical protein
MAVGQAWMMATQGWWWTMMVIGWVWMALDVVHWQMMIYILNKKKLKPVSVSL